MTSFQIRTGAHQRDAGADVLLDWLPGKSASTVAYEPSFLRAVTTSPVARDLLHLGGAVYCADKVAKREHAADAWTRELQLQVPVSDVALWNTVKPTVVAALTFLSGDQWEVDFVVDDEAEPARTESAIAEYDHVSLFSGGLDSLAGVIDALERGENLVLVGHHDSSLTDNRQRRLFAALRARYGDGRIQHRRLWLRPAGRRMKQARPLPAGVENTTRSRSFLFFAAGVALADGLGRGVPLYVPENGLIGINVPLTPARAGSLSTRTTHPLYMDYWSQLLTALGLDHAIENPYRFKTKGEMLVGSANRQLALALAGESVSCSHPEAPRWVKRPQGNCGYCYPCLIRRAALHRVGADSANDYAWDALTDASLLSRASRRGGSLRALAASLTRPERTDDVLRNGRIPNGETKPFFEVYSRGREELRTWLHGAGPELRRRLP